MFLHNDRGEHRVAAESASQWAYAPVMAGAATDVTDAHLTTVDGACHHDCPDSCGWTATVDRSGPEPVVVKLRGNPDHPFSAGELCPKVNRFVHRVYSPDRLLHPLRRVGGKGSGDFEQVS